MEGRALALVGVQGPEDLKAWLETLEPPLDIVPAAPRGFDQLLDLIHP